MKSQFYTRELPRNFFWEIFTDNYRCKNFEPILNSVNSYEGRARLIVEVTLGLSQTIGKIVTTLFALKTQLKYNQPSTIYQSMKVTTSIITSKFMLCGKQDNKNIISKITFKFLLIYGKTFMETEKQ